MDEETKSYVGFSLFPGIGPVRFTLLLDYFGTAKAAWNATRRDYNEIHLGEKLTDAFVKFRERTDIDAYIASLQKKRVMVLPITHPKYPALLKQISDAPFLLYVKGDHPTVPIDLNRTIGVVGTRKVTPYGVEVTKRIVTELVSYGFTIVSGLAYGVDAVAHTAAIESGGNTIAVLGCGIDVIAPPSNAGLYEKIIHGRGVIVSEMPLGLRPNKGLFPARNRIISGLSLGVVVTEGADDSGALITARNAGEQGREVFAVPGPITSAYSKGPAQLLKKGATLVESVEDIIEALGITKHGDQQLHNSVNLALFSIDEQKIIRAINANPLQIDEIVRTTGLTISQVGSTVTVLEMKGIVKDLGDKVYSMT